MREGIGSRCLPLIFKKERMIHPFFNYLVVYVELRLSKGAVSHRRMPAWTRRPNLQCKFGFGGWRWAAGIGQWT